MICPLMRIELSVEKPVQFSLRKYECCVLFSEVRVKLVPTIHVIGTVSLEMLLPANIIIVLRLSGIYVLAVC